MLCCFLPVRAMAVMAKGLGPLGASASINASTVFVDDVRIGMRILRLDTVHFKGVMFAPSAASLIDGPATRRLEFFSIMARQAIHALLLSQQACDQLSDQLMWATRWRAV